jgi:hypothetical protein
MARCRALARHGHWLDAPIGAPPPRVFARISKRLPYSFCAWLVRKPVTPWVVSGGRFSESCLVAGKARTHLRRENDGVRHCEER